VNTLTADFTDQEEQELLDRGRDAYSIAEFCLRHRISSPLYFKMRKAGRGPREIRIGKKILISKESAADWRRAREAEATAATVVAE
jgi:hypothetical protein